MPDTVPDAEAAVVSSVDVVPASRNVQCSGKDRPQNKSKWCRGRDYGSDLDRVPWKSPSEDMMFKGEGKNRAML